MPVGALDRACWSIGPPHNRRLSQISYWPAPCACRRSGRLFEVSAACGGLTDATLAEVAQYLRLLASCSQEVAGGAAAAAARGAAPPPAAHRSGPSGDSSPAAAARGEGTLGDEERRPASVSGAERQAGSAAAPSEEAGPAGDGTVLAQTHRAAPHSDTLPAGAHAVC